MASSIQVNPYDYQPVQLGTRKRSTPLAASDQLLDSREARPCKHVKYSHSESEYDDLVERSVERSSLRLEINELRAADVRATRTMNDMRDVQERQHEEMSNLNRTLKQLSDKVTAETAAVANSTNKSNALQRDLKDALSKIDSLKTGLAQERASKLESVQHAKTISAKLQAECDAHIASKNYADTAYDKLVKSKQDIDTAYDNLDETVEILREQNTELTMQEQQASTAVSQLRKDHLRELATRQKNHEAQLAVFHKKLSKVQDAHLATKTTLNLYQSKDTEMTGTDDSAPKTIEEMVEENTMLWNDNKTKAEKIVSLKNKNGKLVEQNDTLVEEKDTLGDDMKDLQDDNQKLEDENESLKDEKKSLETDKKDLEEDKKSLEEEKDSDEKEIRNLKQDIVELKDEHDEWCEYIQGGYDKLQDRNSDLQNEIAQLQAKSKNLQVRPPSKAGSRQRPTSDSLRSRNSQGRSGVNKARQPPAGRSGTRSKSSTSNVQLLDAAVVASEGRKACEALAKSAKDTRVERFLNMIVTNASDISLDKDAVEKVIDKLNEFKVGNTLTGDGPDAAGSSKAIQPPVDANDDGVDDEEEEL